MTPGIVAVYVSGTSFRVAGNLTADFAAGVRVLADCGVDGTPLGTVTGSSYAAPNTTVNVTLDSGSLTANLTHVWHGNDIPASLCNHGTQHMLGGRDAITPEDIGAMPADREIATTSPLWGGGTLWDDLILGIDAASTSATGVVELATSTEAVAGTDATRVPPVSAHRQAFLSWIRDTVGQFVGLPLPSFNLFAPSLAIPATATFTRASSGTRINAAGLVESVTTDVPRFGFDPLTGLIRGLRLEGPATNAATYSEVFDNPAWTKTRASITADATTAPDGAATADKLVEDSTATNSHYISKSMTFVSGVTYTISRYVKAGERSVCQINFPATYVPANALFNLATRAITPSGAGVVAYGIEELPGGFLRCWLTATATASGSGLVVVFLHDGTSGTYSGNGTSGLFLWGAQMEEGPFPTTYVPTTSAAVTRAADLLTAALSGIAHSTAAGALFLAGRTPPGAPLAGTSQIVAQIDDGTADNRITVERTTASLLRVVIVSGGSTVATLELGTVGHDTDFRVAVSWSAATFVASLNGGPAVTDSDGAAPSGLATIRLGADHAPANFWGGFVRHAAFFPRSLTTTQLQAIIL